MGQVVAIKKPLEKLVLEIRGHVHDAGRAETTCAKHQLQAGARLLELRERVEAGEAGEISWWDWFDQNFTGYIKSRSYAEKLMRWARSDDPESTIEHDRAVQREAMQKIRDRTQSHVRQAENQKDRDYDIVEHALHLVARMSTDERERFDSTYRETYP